MNHYLVDGDNRYFAGESMPEYDEGYQCWRTDSGLLSDPARRYAIQEEPEQAVPPTMGPIAFNFVWTVKEQLAIDELCDGPDQDKVVARFMRILGDPRTDEVVLALPSVQSAIAHTLSALAEKGTIDAESIPTRLAEILSGTMQ